MTASEIPASLDDLQADEESGQTDILAPLRAAEKVDVEARATQIAKAVRQIAETVDPVGEVTLEDYVRRRKLLKAGQYKAIIDDARAARASREAASAQRDTAADTSEVAAAFAALGGELTLAELLNLVLKTLKRFIVFPSQHAAVAATLFAALAHVQPELQFAPRLDIRSPIKRCGKSRLFDLLVLLVHKALVTVNISAAAVVHAIDEGDPPTIMLDEADRTFSAAKGDEKAEALIGILNGGYERGRPYIRHDPATRSNRECPTFAMAVIAGIGKRPDTIEDRSVIITLQRKAPGDNVEKYRTRRHKPYVLALGKQLQKLVAPHAKEIGAAEPGMPSGLNDRAEDTWEGLLAVADVAGGGSALARAAAQNLSGEAEEDAAESQRLLDVATVFTIWEPGAGDDFTAMGMHDKLHTETILKSLWAIPEAPWSEIKGKPLTDRGLAKLLGEYKVRSRDVKIDGINKKGYYREDLHDAWSRYAPQVELPALRPPADQPSRGQLPASDEKSANTPSATSATVATAQVDPVALDKSEALPALPGTGGAGAPMQDETGPDLHGSAGSAQANTRATALTREVAPVAPVAHDLRASDSTLALLERELGAELVETSANGQSLVSANNHRPGHCEKCGDAYDGPVHAITCAGYDPAV